MPFPAGVREGEFVKFEGWDVPGNDIGQFFTNVSGDSKITALKKATLRYGSTFFAFNSNGWCKTWSQIDPSKFVRANATLYIRVEYPGWVFYPGEDARSCASHGRGANASFWFIVSDSSGNDFGNVNVNATPAIIAQIYKRSNPFDVVGFNTNGWIKNKIVFPLGPFPPNSALIEGSYVRDDYVQ